MLLNSYAKLNLYLQVISRRADGFHNIKTIFERISLCDKIILKPRSDNSIKVTCSNHRVPQGKANLAYQAARLLQQKFNLKKGADIHIIKHIPMGAGLGGGSSNAAAVLCGLNKLWQLDISVNRLVTLSKEIGCDIAFFLFKVPFALGSSRGDKIKPLTALNKTRLYHLLIVPKINVSTPLIYNKWDEFCGLTNSSVDVKISFPSRLINRFNPEDRSWLFNSLQEITCRIYPEVKVVLNKLALLGQRFILMSGSGPAIFAICKSRQEASRLKRRLTAKERSWQVFLVETA